MELINNLISDHLMNAIGWTIIHSLWQASFVALAMSIYLNRYQKEQSIVRYRIALSSLYILLGLSIITFCVHYFNPGQHGIDIVYSATTIDLSSLSGSHYIQDFTFGLVHHFDFITTMWITGMMVFTLKFIGGYVLIKRYELSGEIIQESKVHVILNDLLDKMNLDKPVQVLESTKVYTPMMLGHFKPIILLPMGIINRLELNEVEAILAHELSHISRNDFLQNILQSFIEIVYYYHPAVWWISANVRAERENCCDEEAVRLCGNAVNYAKALVKIEEMQNTGIPSLAIPMARSKNNLFNRVSRILNQPQTKSQIKEKMVATLLLFSVFTVFGESNHSIIEAGNAQEEITFYTSDNGHFNVIVKEQERYTEDKQEESAEKLVRTIVIDSEDSHLVIDTIPTDDCNCSDVSIESQSDDRSFKLKIDNGVIKEFKINGKDINDASKYFKLGEHGSIIKTDDGQILLKEFGTNFNSDKDDELRSYDYEKLEEDELLKAPFKISGNNELPFIIGQEDNLERILEKISESHHITKEQMDLMKNWKWSLEPLEKNLEPSILQLLESLNLKDALAFEGLNWPIPSAAPVLPRGFIFPDMPEAPMPPQGPQIKPFEGYHNFNKKPSGQIFRALQSDGLIQPGEENTLEITDKYLKINGEKQPTNIWKKYKKIYESQLGHELMKGSKIKLKERTKANSRFFIG